MRKNTLKASPLPQQINQQWEATPRQQGINTEEGKIKKVTSKEETNKNSLMIKLIL